MAQTLPNVATKLKRARRAAKLTQRALAHKIGLRGNGAGAFISRLEHGTQEPRISNLVKIAKVLGVHLGELV